MRRRPVRAPDTGDDDGFEHNPHPHHPTDHVLVVADWRVNARAVITRASAATKSTRAPSASSCPHGCTASIGPGSIGQLSMRAAPGRHHHRLGRRRGADSRARERRGPRTSYRDMRRARGLARRRAPDLRPRASLRRSPFVRSRPPCASSDGAGGAEHQRPDSHIRRKPWPLAATANRPLRIRLTAACLADRRGKFGAADGAKGYVNKLSQGGAS